MSMETDIIKALRTIKQVCAQTNSCPECCFYKQDTGCAIKNEEYPEDWVLNEKEEVWRAFK